MQEMDIEEASRHLTELVAAAKRGESTVILEGGRRVAVIEPQLCPAETTMSDQGQSVVEHLMKFPGFGEETSLGHDAFGGPAGAPPLSLDPGAAASEQHFWSLLARFPGLIDETELDPFARHVHW
jgi:antitoxin (DNA-binding transcriptional repressor) of toxin-antitoxin stability system